MSINKISPIIQKPAMKIKNLKQLALPVVISAATIIGITNSNDKFEKQDNLPKIEEYSPVSNAMNDLKLAGLLLVSFHLKDPNKKIYEKGRTELHQAVCDKNPDAIKKLLKAGANINVQDDDGNTPLHLAIEYANKGCINRDIANVIDNLLNDPNIDPNIQDNNGNAPIHTLMEYLKRSYDEAVGIKFQFNKELLCQLLKSDKVDVNKFDGNGVIPLNVAVDIGNSEIARLLLDNHNININQFSELSISPSLYALDYSQYDIASQFLDKKPFFPNVRDERGNTLLIMAVKRGPKFSTPRYQTERLEFIKKLISKVKSYLDFNEQDSQGNTALHHASKTGDIEILHLLRDSNKDINVNLKNKQGETAFLQTGLKLQAIGELLNFPDINVNAQDSQGNTLLHMLCNGENFKNIDLILNRNVLQRLLKFPDIDVNIRNNEGNTALQCAIQSKNTYIIEELLSNPHFDTGISNSNGNSLLNSAIELGNLNTAKMLLNKPDIDITARDKNGDTFLHYAMRSNNPDIANLLISNPKIDINARNTDGNTALHAAVQSLSKKSSINKDSDLQAINALLNSPNINVNIKNNNCRTALHLASELNVPAIVDLLHKKSIDVNAQDNDGNTALHLGTLKSNDNVTKALLELPDININIKNNEGDSALTLAVRKEHSSIVAQILLNPNLSPYLKSLIDIKHVAYRLTDGSFYFGGITLRDLNKSLEIARLMEFNDSEKLKKIGKMDYTKSNSYKKIFVSGLSEQGLKILCNQKEDKKHGFDNLLFEYVRNNDMLNLNNMDNENLFDKIAEHVDTFDQTDENGISIFEYILNSENSLLLDKIAEKRAQFEYQRAFDYAYNNIQDDDFKQKVNKYKSLVKFANVNKLVDGYMAKNVPKETLEKLATSPFFTVDEDLRENNRY